MTTESQVFEVRRDDLAQTRLVGEAQAPAGEGEVLLRIDAFALTANNITYGVTGDMIGYWQFFPAAEEGWGRIPVWGFAEVVDSAVADIPVGERVYGYLPMAEHLRVRPTSVSPRGFRDGATHRAQLPLVYNQYQRCAADPGYRREQEGLLMLFRPLYTTSFFIDDFLADNRFFGAQSVVLSSASSKTAFSLAWLLKQRDDGVQVIGLTSAPNRAFVESLGCYDQVLSYDGLDSLPEGTAVFVDMAGNADLRSRIHHHYRERLAYSCSVGATHWESAALRGGPELPGPKPTLFFAPSQVEKRTAEWGSAGVAERIAAAWVPFAEQAADWIRLREESGGEAVTRAYESLLHNRADPAEGLILSLSKD
jgi:hypothetical protein